MDGRYRIASQLGEGLTSMVFEAVELSNGRAVALELVHPGLAADSTFRERFEREVALARQLHDARIIETYAHGTTSDGLLYAVTELVTAPRLDRVLADAYQLPWQRALHIVEQLCAPLHAAHAVGLLHRKLAAHKIHLETRPAPDTAPTGNPYRDAGFATTDFVRLRISSSAVVLPPLPDGTFQNHRLGHLEAMSPEQLDGLPIDARSDIYSLGLLAYQMLTGRGAFVDCNGPAQRFLAQVRGRPTPPSQLIADLPDAADTVVMTCLARGRHDRYPDVLALRDAIRALRSG